MIFDKESEEALENEFELRKVKANEQKPAMKRLSTEIYSRTIDMLNKNYSEKSIMNDFKNTFNKSSY